MSFVTDAGIQRILTLLDADATVIALQDGAIPPNESSTQLNSEAARKVVSLDLIDGTTLIKEAYFDETEANITITGWGVFGGGATDTPNSGTLIAATPANFTKTNEDSLTVSAEITVRRYTP